MKVGEICDKLCDLILEGKAELRDIYSIGAYSGADDGKYLCAAVVIVT